MKFKGIYTPLITPFLGDETIDWDTWQKLIDLQIKAGVEGIIVGGTTGEFYSLTLEDRMKQFDVAKEQIAGRCQLFAGVNAMSFKECCQLGEAAREKKLNGIMLAAPPYSLPSQRELIEHCLKIDQKTQLPILLYNYPARAGVDMGEVFLNRVGQNSRFQAIKESSGSIKRVQMLARKYPHIQLMAGAEDQVLEAFVWGAQGWVSATANIFPEACVTLCQVCAEKKDFVTGQKIMSVLMPLMDMFENGDQFIPAVKYACEVLGIQAGLPRPPMKELFKQDKRTVREVVTRVHQNLQSFLLKK